MGSKVTIKIDARALYGLIAVFALAGIFAMAVWLGIQLGVPADPRPAASDSQPAASDVQPVAAVQQPAAQPTLQARTALPTLKPPVGGPPISLEDQPVGDNEPRVWIGDEGPENNFNYDLGLISGSEVTVKELAVTNIGTGDLEIIATGASCGCTVAKIEKKWLAPGESTLLKVTYDPNKLHEQGSFVRKKVQLKTNDPLVPVAEISFQADVDTK